MSTDNAFIFDTHAHYDDEVFINSLDTLIPEMEKAGVKKIITCGCNLKSSINAIKLAEKYDIIYAAVGIVISIVSQIGELSMSLIKRHYNIKDFGKLFPGHGGILDRFDSVLAVSLVLFIILSALVTFNIIVI